MPFFDRRGFLSLSTAFAAGPFLLGQDKPKDPEDSLFLPDTLFLTWQRDPTSTMTIQWVGPKAGDAVIRYRSRSSNEWLYGPDVKANMEILLRFADSPLPLPFGSFSNLRSLLAILLWKWRQGQVKPMFMCVQFSS